MFASYELNPVSVHAQASVPVPDGLDLDAWIVPPPKEPSPEKVDAKKKVKKGKGKETIGVKSKKKQKDEDEGNRDGAALLGPPEPEVETADERAERERVR